MGKCRKCGSYTASQGRTICHVCLGKWADKRLSNWNTVKAELGDPTKENIEQLKSAIRKLERGEKI